jgi:N-acetylmuramoyl-L-alanine amidase
LTTDGQDDKRKAAEKAAQRQAEIDRLFLREPDSRFVADLHPSPNIGARNSGLRPSILIMHYTGMASAPRAIDWLSRPESHVSCHYVIDEDGRITQMVAESTRAWHAGVSFWQGETDINSASIGIEIQNPGHDDGYHPFPRAQMRGVRDLARDIIARHDIAPERVLAHSDIAPARKIDPGEKFDWAWLAKVGIGHWVAPLAVDDKDPGAASGPHTADTKLMQTLLARYGYDTGACPAFDKALQINVKAFQRHFRPERVDGRIDRSTLGTLQALIAALPTRADGNSSPKSGQNAGASAV